MSGKYKKNRDSAQQRPNPLAYSQPSPVSVSPSEARTVQEAGTVFERVRTHHHPTTPRRRALPGSSQPPSLSCEFYHRIKCNPYASPFSKRWI
jgi:hypothetical protein